MKKIVSLILALTMACTLCACDFGRQEPSLPDEPGAGFHGGSLGKPEQSQDRAEQETVTEPEASETVPETEPEPVRNFSPEGLAAIDALREEINQAGAIFGVAYIGSFFRGEMTFEDWFEDSAGGLDGCYPFVSEIDRTQAANGTGHLYCILAGDYDTAITARDLNGEVLYSAENGDPVLLFCSRNGEGMIPDTVITFTTAEGAEYQWEAKLDGANYPDLLIGPERQLLSWDFTFVYDLGFELTGWLVEGWLGPTKTGLAGTDVFEGMCWWIRTNDGTRNSYCLRFCPNGGEAYDGEVILDCYHGDDTEPLGHWEGWWSITPVMDYASWVHMDLMLMDGTDQDRFAESQVISENYMALLAPSGERLLLVADTTQTVLPLFPDGWRFGELALAMG